MFARLIAAVAVGLLWCGASSALAQLQLVTEDEARLPEAKLPQTRAITRAPGIKLVSPPEVQGRSFALDIRFEARGAVQLDPASLKVEYLKEPVIDVTQRVRGLLRADTLSAAQVRLPPGRHVFRVGIKDVEGRATSTVIELQAR